MKIKRILVPTDYSPGSRSALEESISLAKTLHASIDVVHVFAPAPGASPEMTLRESGGGGERLAAEEMVREMPLKEIDAFLDAVERNGVRLRGRIEAGDSAEAIVRLAEEEAFDLIVMPTHGRRGLDRWILGSVTERVVRKSRVPVLTIHLRNDA